jgi:tRNA dimethylallyltransferase
MSAPVAGADRAVLLMGPTGCGKSAHAMRLAQELPVEIVSVDSAQVYRGMDIGTAKPNADERARVPHHLIDVRDPEETYSAGDFRVDALALIPQILARGRVPLLVGGTFLYFRALLHGLAELPPRDAALRASLDARAAAEGWPALHAELAARDPESARRIHPNDAQRIQRALEIVTLAGESRTRLWRSQADAAPAPIAFGAFRFEPSDRAALGTALDARFRTMLAAGLLDEVRRLRDRGTLTAAHPAVRAVGYRQLWAFCDGDMSWEEACRAAMTATRQLAKRQFTWLRSSLTAPAEVQRTFDPQNSKCYERFRAAVFQWLGRDA